MVIRHVFSRLNADDVVSCRFATRPNWPGHPAKENIRKVDVVEFPELGMEAIWKIEVEDFPAFILVDDKGNDFFETVGPGCSH